jgi:hypothetical protein
MKTPTITPSPHRKRRSRKQVTKTDPPPVTPLHLVSATVVDFTGSDAIVSLVFDNVADDPLVNVDGAQGTNWVATIEDYLFGGNTSLEQAAFNTITLFMGNQGLSSGGNRISYLATPADIVTASGRTLAAFSDHVLGGL